MKKYLPHFAIGGLLVLAGIIAVNNANLSFLSQPIKGFTCPSVSQYANLKSTVADSLCTKLQNKYATESASKSWLTVVQGVFAKKVSEKKASSLIVSADMFAYMAAGTQTAIDLKNKPVDEEGDTLKEIDEIGSSPDVISTCKNGETKTVTTTTNCGCDEIHTCSEGVWKKTSETACRPCIAPRDEKIVDDLVATAQDVNPGVIRSVVSSSDNSAKAKDISYTVTTSPNPAPLPFIEDGSNDQYLSKPLQVEVKISKTPASGVKNIIIRGYNQGSYTLNIAKDIPIESYTFASNASNTYKATLSSLSKYTQKLLLYVFIETNNGEFYSRTAYSQMSESSSAKEEAAWGIWTHGEGCTRIFNGASVTLKPGRILGIPALTNAPIDSISATHITNKDGSCTSGPLFYCYQGYLNGSKERVPMASMSNEEIANKGLKIQACGVNEDLSCNVYTKQYLRDSGNSVAFTVKNGESYSYYNTQYGLINIDKPKYAENLIIDTEAASRRVGCGKITKYCENGRWQLDNDGYYDETVGNTVWVGYKKCMTFSQTKNGNPDNLKKCDNDDYNLAPRTDPKWDITGKNGYVENFCKNDGDSCFDIMGKPQPQDNMKQTQEMHYIGRCGIIK